MLFQDSSCLLKCLLNKSLCLRLWHPSIIYIYMFVYFALFPHCGFFAHVMLYTFNHFYFLIPAFYFIFRFHVKQSHLFLWQKVYLVHVNKLLNRVFLFKISFHFLQRLSNIQLSRYVFRECIIILCKILLQLKISILLDTRFRKRVWSYFFVSKEQGYCSKMDTTCYKQHIDFPLT